FPQTCCGSHVRTFCRCRHLAASQLSSVCRNGRFVLVGRGNFLLFVVTRLCSLLRMDRLRIQQVPSEQCCMAVHTVAASLSVPAVLLPCLLRSGHPGGEDHWPVRRISATH